jgi:hypothetical protein
MRLLSKVWNYYRLRAGQRNRLDRTGAAPLAVAVRRYFRKVAAFPNPTGWCLKRRCREPHCFTPCREDIHRGLMF